jgi:hypothetical protein
MPAPLRLVLLEGVLEMRTEQEPRSAKKPCLRRLLDGLPLGGLEASIVILVLASLEGNAAAQVKREWLVTYDANEPSLAWSLDIVGGSGLDAAGNLYVVGTVMRPHPGGGTESHFKMQKYGPRGKLLWDVEDAEVRNLGSFAVDPEGNTYIAACTGDNPEDREDFLILKYHSAGHLCWARRRDFDGRTENAVTLAIDESGNVHVGGHSTARDEQGAWTDWWVMFKYDSGGNEVWARMDWDRHPFGYYCVDSLGNLYGWWSLEDYSVRKYDPDGQTLWTTTYDGPAHRRDEMFHVALDAEGNLYGTGWSQGSDELWDCATVKFSPDGQQLWAARYDGPDHAGGMGDALAIDSTGNVYVAARLMLPGGTWDWITLKYDPEGNEVWARRYLDDARREGEWNHPVALDPAGNVYVACSMQKAGISIVKYDPDGNLVWSVSDLEVFAAFVTNAAREGGWILVDDSYNVHVAGTVFHDRSSVASKNFDFMVAKFSQGFPSFRRGDATSDGALQLTDAVFTLSYLFRAGPDPSCLDAADADDNGAVQITDAIFTLNHLFLGGPPLPAPTGGCGPDPSEDGLGCEASPACP